MAVGALSSVVEHYLHTVGVAGSKPAARTIFWLEISTGIFYQEKNPIAISFASIMAHHQTLRDSRMKRWVLGGK
jgi:hypothetical protein